MLFSFFGILLFGCLVFCNFAHVTEYFPYIREKHNILRKTQSSIQKQDIVRRLIDSGHDFALYRFPNETEPHLVLQLQGRAERPQDGQEYSGFVFAPFAETKAIPTLLINPDVAVSEWALIDEHTQSLRHRRPALSNIILENTHGDIDQSESYKMAFRTFRNLLDREEYQKLVLSYSMLAPWKYSGYEDELFMLALEKFRDSMVYLVYTHKGGRWFGCTPELLIEGYGRKWRTMSLAGTMPSDSKIPWSPKNIHEQELVSQYLEGQLQDLRAQVMRRGPYTVRAGNLIHLRTDFTFHTPTPHRAREIIDLLHPTPAVCGLPKDEALRFIRQHERNRRMYYAGYLGPVNLRAETCVYVNIRCCNIRPGGKAVFFAGGGLTRDSMYFSEKEEIKRKLNTLLSI